MFMHTPGYRFRRAMRLLPVLLSLATCAGVYAQDSLKYRRHDLALTIGRTDSSAVLKTITDKIRLFISDICLFISK